jgi:hypothetical protein
MTLLILASTLWLNSIEAGLGDTSYTVREKATKRYKKFWMFVGLRPLSSPDPEVRTRAENALGRPVRSLLAVLDDPQGRVAFAIISNSPPDSLGMFALWSMWGEESGDKIRFWMVYILDLYKLRVTRPGQCYPQEDGGMYDTTYIETFSWVQRAPPIDTRWGVYQNFWVLLREESPLRYRPMMTYQESLKDIRSRYQRVINAVPR